MHHNTTTNNEPPRGRREHAHPHKVNLSKGDYIRTEDGRWREVVGFRSGFRGKLVVGYAGGEWTVGDREAITSILTPAGDEVRRRRGLMPPEES